MAQQNVFLGLPLQLLPEEVVLLLTKGALFVRLSVDLIDITDVGLAYLVDDSAAHRPATDQQSADYLAARAASIQQQQADIAAFAIEKKAAMQRVHADAIAKKRAEKHEKKARLKEASSASTSTASDRDAVALSAQDDAEGSRKVEEKATFEPPYAIRIAGSSRGKAWYTPNDAAVTYHDLDSARQAGLWRYPETLLQRAKCAVFQDLWEKGHFLGNGLRFGGDFLVYPGSVISRSLIRVSVDSLSCVSGDSLRYHSHFSTTVVPSPLSKISPMDLVAYGRLATGVKKAHLVCGYDEHERTVSYYSLEWAAM